GGSACATHACDVSSYQCVYQPRAGCCASDADCNDHDSCTTDQCNPMTGACSNARSAACCNSAADCDDHDSCTTDTCSGPGGTCARSALMSCCHTDSDCQSASTFCQGAGICDGIHGCQRGAPPTCDDFVACTDDRCDAQAQACVHTTVDTRCDDGIFCNGS